MEDIGSLMDPCSSISEEEERQYYCKSCNYYGHYIDNNPYTKEGPEGITLDLNLMNKSSNIILIWSLGAP